MKKKEPNDIDEKSNRADDNNKLGLVNRFHFDEPLERFHENGETQGDQEDRIN